MSDGPAVGALWRASGPAGWTEGPSGRVDSGTYPTGVAEENHPPRQ